jgi:uroporphyrinogen III methyltransferase/synthase
VTTPAPVPVLLVGAGPGDPDLLTLRAEAALAGAALVLTDPALVPLAAAFAPGAEVGPAPSDPAAVADRCARAAGPVVRLYRGDPWLHPAHAAEAAALGARGLATEAVPGPPAEFALAGAAGLAIHHRPRAATLTLAPTAAALPPPGDPARTLVAEADDVRTAAAALVAAPADRLAAAIVVDGVAVRGHLPVLAATAPAAPGLVVVGAVTA